MNTQKLLFACFLSLILLFNFNTCSTTANEILEQNCSPSSCGNIHNISYPFRLKSDPQGCGVDVYELSCEDNTTVLYLNGGKFNVKAINYNNYTIRVVDPGVDNDDCSSLPHFPLSLYNLSDDGYMYWDPFSVEEVEVIKCVEPVNSTTYLDASSCFQQLNTPSSFFYRYADVEDVRLFDLKYSCSLEAITLIQSPENSVSSYIEFHRLMAFGFELLYSGYHLPLYCSPCISGTQECCRYHITPESDSKSVNKTGDSKSVTETLKNYAEAFGYGLQDSFSYISILFGDDYSHRISIDRVVQKFKVDIVRYQHLDRATGYWQLRASCLLVMFAAWMYAIARSLCGTPFVIAFLIYKWRRRHLSEYHTIEKFLQGQNNLMPIRYAYSNIKKMTRSFNELLGKGGFGSVYKGKLRSGQFAAIKMLEKSKANGQDFINEVATIGRIHHANIVQLIGFCSEGSKHALVYEFMSNGSLDSHIFSSERSNFLSWEKLYEISLGVARGIKYLHQGCDIQILHFDIKPHNILLDENFTPKISDFGLAKFYPKTDSIASLTAARGTIGYMAPELFYKNIGRVSYKADVYSFGMLILEMTGKRKNLKVPAEDASNENLSQIYYPFWVYDKLLDGKVEIEDATNEENKIVRKMIITGLWCIQMQPSKRPSMNKVVDMLEGDLESLQFPPRPILFPIESMKKDQEDSSSSFSVDSANAQQ